MGQMHTINVKNMVCPRCITVVNEILEKIGLRPETVRLGQVSLTSELNKSQMESLDELLLHHGFERIDDKKAQTLEYIKTAVIDLIHHQDHFNLNINWSDYLSEKIGNDYQYLSSLFSSVAGITLEQYIIKQKIEKVKEYLIYKQLSVKEIAFKLGYSSVAHLSSQFKKVTGMTPSAFKQSHDLDARRPLDRLL